MNVTITHPVPAELVTPGDVLLLGVERADLAPPTACTVEETHNTTEGIRLLARPVGRNVKRRVVTVKAGDNVYAELTPAEAINAMAALTEAMGHVELAVHVGVGSEAMLAAVAELADPGDAE